MREGAGKILSLIKFISIDIDVFLKFFYNRDPLCVIFTLAVSTLGSRLSVILPLNSILLYKCVISTKFFVENIQGRAMCEINRVVYVYNVFLPYTDFSYVFSEWNKYDLYTEWYVIGDTAWNKVISR